VTATRLPSADIPTSWSTLDAIPGVDDRSRRWLCSTRRRWCDAGNVEGHELAVVRTATPPSCPGNRRMMHQCAVVPTAVANQMSPDAPPVPRGLAATDSNTTKRPSPKRPRRTRCSQPRMRRRSSGGCGHLSRRKTSDTPLPSRTRLSAVETNTIAAVGRDADIRDGTAFAAAWPVATSTGRSGGRLGPRPWWPSTEHRHEGDRVLVISTSCGMAETPAPPTGPIGAERRLDELRRYHPA
jgi:hypothetical protein